METPATTQTPALTGTIYYLARIALPPEAQVEVTLRCVSPAGAEAPEIANVTFAAQSRQVPIPWELRYEVGAIDGRRRYAVSARITVGGQERWRSRKEAMVLTRGSPSTGIEIQVEPVR